MNALSSVTGPCTDGEVETVILPGGRVRSSNIRTAEVCDVQFASKAQGGIHTHTVGCCWRVGIERPTDETNASRSQHRVLQIANREWHHGALASDQLVGPECAC